MKCIKYLLVISIFSSLIFSCSSGDSKLSETENDALLTANRAIAEAPPLGWNSFDSYGVYLHEKAALANLEAFAEKLAPSGYKYFVIDAGWFGEFQLQQGTIYPAEKHAAKLNINEYGLLQPSQTYFPNGIKPIIEKCHELGLKFGIHLMRGIPRAAYEKNTKIKGTEYTARDIADTTSICVWNDQNFGIDMDKPGAQAFYNSLVKQMADWGVDFLKYDDLVPYPKEIEGIANAIDNSGRPIVLSLSPGNELDTNRLAVFKRANMLRVTPDIWDDQEGIDQCFAAWRKWQGKEERGFWIDMDMIPFGQLQLMSPLPEGVDSLSTKWEVQKKIDTGELENIELLAGKGWNRWSQFTKDQMLTFISMRALAASPLMMGGDLPTLDQFSLKLITDQNVIACNQNGVMGHLISENNNIEIWKTPEKGTPNGWIGVFNRTDELIEITIDNNLLDLKEGISYELTNIWEQKALSQKASINSNGVIFIRYTKL